MKKLLIAVLVSVPLVGCTEEVIVKKAPAPAGTAAPTPEQTTEPTDPPPSTPPSTTTPDNPSAASQAPEDRCLDGQDMDGADVDIKACPELPAAPDDVVIGKAAKDAISLGAWELGTTADGDTYKYGSLSAPGTNPRTLKHDTGSVAVNAQNVECWAKGYYRLRKMLQNPPAEWMALRKAGFQYRFFQFQTDLRNGPTGFRAITSFQDHLVKWVTVISASGACQQPTLTKFRDYAKAELTERGLPQPTTN